MLECLATAFYVVVCVLLFALAILVHELGHFVVALKLGLRVEAFSIGFGHAVWKRRFRGVEYRIGWIPLGGYVSIPDVDPEGTKVLEQSSVPSVPCARIPAWKEIAVAVAGPGMNLVFAVALAVSLSIAPGAKFGTLAARIGGVVPDGPAAEAGLRPGDVVKSVGGRAVGTWTEMQTEIQISGGRPVELVVGRGDGGKDEVSLVVTPRRNEVSGAWYILALSETNATGAVAWMPARSPWRQLAWDAGSIFRVLRGLVTPKDAKATAGALGGPVLIAEGLYQQVRRDKWDALGFLRFLNVNLAVLNLLPIPVLDGGLVLFALVALVCRRRLPDWFVAKVSLAFMVALMGLMAVLVCRDGLRSYRIHTYRPAAEAASDVHEKPDAQP